MYQAYWGLAESPFRSQQAERYFHLGPTQEEALARLHFLVNERRTLGLLLGTAGVGKSQMLDVFARQLGPIDRQTATLRLVALSWHDFLWSLSSQLGIGLRTDATPFKLTRSIEDHLAANRSQRIHTILLLDDADEARPEVLGEILRLLQLDSSSESRLTLVVTAQPERLNRLGTRLLELAELRIDMEGWSVEDTASFIKNALSAAGRSTPLFSEAAVIRLHELSGGIPRRVKQLADLTLLAGAGAGDSQIESQTVEATFRELGVVAPGLSLSLARSSRTPKSSTIRGYRWACPGVSIWHCPALPVE